jgi:phosphate:Na+ symporter
MVIGLANQGLMNLPAGVSIMMGAELGTCTDTVIATVGRGRAAVNTGLFHLGFNLLSIILGLLLFWPFLDLVMMISNDSSLARKVANAHVLFNVAGVIIFLPFASWVADRLESLSAIAEDT